MKLLIIVKYLLIADQFWLFLKQDILAVSLALGTQVFLIEAINFKVNTLKGPAPGKYPMIISMAMPSLLMIRNH